MTHDEMIAVIAAHKDGKEIQCRNLLPPSVSVDYVDTQIWSKAHHIRGCGFDFIGFEYRIKPAAPPKPREWWISLNEIGTVAGGIPYHIGHPINAIHVREVSPPTREENT